MLRLLRRKQENSLRANANTNSSRANATHQCQIDRKEKLEQVEVNHLHQVVATEEEPGSTHRPRLEAKQAPLAAVLTEE